MNTEPWSPCFIYKGCPMRRSVKSCVFRKERYVPGSSTRIGSCKTIWTNFGKTLFLKSALKMDEFDENEIGRLLRLKRFEQPPPGYFENFLHEFHRRQRDELLRQPLWRICLERAHDFMFKLNVPSLTSYPAAATALLVFAAVISFKIYQAPENTNLAGNRP